MEEGYTNTVQKKRIESSSESNRNFILLAIIEHGSKPAAYVLIGFLVFIFLFSVREPLFSTLNRAEELQFGDFVYRAASEEGVSRELKELASLSYDQIQLFIIIGRERPDDNITYLGPESKEENYRKLQEIGLIENILIEINQETGKRDLSWRTTVQGDALHDLLMKEVVKAIREAERV